jgi:hypothetical protein
MWQQTEAMLDQFTFTAQTWSRCISQMSVAGETTFHLLLNTCALFRFP